MAEGESLSQHAAAASQRALDMAGVAAKDVDLIILATSSPDDLFGSACQAGRPLPCLPAMLALLRTQPHAQPSYSG
jgi:3-oxoacyl-[acyl-carrier-protein] synthase III